VCARVALVYNKPEVSRYSTMGEELAVVGVLEAVNAVEASLPRVEYDVSMLPLTPRMILKAR